MVGSIVESEPVFYSNHEDIPSENWRWDPYFLPEEISSHDDQSILVDSDALDTLVRARVLADTPFIITSAYRSPTHNAAVGGAANSAHLRGIAFDISLSGHDRERLLGQCQKAGFGSFGKYSTFLHVDTRPGRRWGSWN